MVFKGKFSINAGVLGAMYCKKYCSQIRVTKSERHEAPRSTQSYGGNTDSSAIHQVYSGEALARAWDAYNTHTIRSHECRQGNKPKNRGLHKIMRNQHFERETETHDVKQAQTYIDLSFPHVQLHR